MPDTEKSLLFDPNEKITYPVFFRNFLKFVSTNATDVIPLFFAYCMFNLCGETDKTPVAGFAVSCFMFFFAFSYDFFEVENTIAAPYFSKKNYRLFTIRTYRVALINLIFFLFSCCLVLLNKPLMNCFNIEEDIVRDTTYFLSLYVPTLGLFFALTNFLRGVVSSVHLHDYFWKICTISLTVSLTCLYVFIVHLKMGYDGMIYGFASKFVVETILMIFLLITKAEKEIFIIPTAKEVFKDFGEVIKFSLNYAAGYYSVSMTFELISLILIKCDNGKHHLLIWVALAQIINGVYYVGYGVGSYGRALGNHFIGLQDKERFKDSLYTCIKYHSLTTYVINIPLFIFAFYIGEMFVDTEEDIKEFAKYLRYLSFFLPLDSILPLMNSFMRLLGHNFFSMILMILGFACVITGVTFVLSFEYGLGALGPVLGIMACNILVTAIALTRIYYNIDFYLEKVIRKAEIKNAKNKDQLEIAEMKGDESTLDSVFVKSDSVSTDQE